MISNDLQQKDIDNLISNFKRLEQTTTAGFQNVNNRLDLMNDHFIRKDFFEEKIKTLKEEIDQLKDTNKWLGRTVASIILSMLIVGALTAFIILK